MSTLGGFANGAAFGGSSRAEKSPAIDKNTIKSLAMYCGIHLSESAAINAVKCLSHKSPSRLINVLLVDILGERAIRNMQSDLDRRVFFAVQTVEFIIMQTLNIEVDVLRTMKNLQNKLRKSTAFMKSEDFNESSVIFEEAMESLLFLKDTMFSGAHQCTIAPSTKNSFKDLFPGLSASPSTTTVVTNPPIATFTTQSQHHKDLLDLYEESMEMVDSTSDQAEPSVTPPAEQPCTTVTNSTTVIVMHVVNKAPKKKEIVKGKWIPVVGQCDGSSSCKQTSKMSPIKAQSQCVTAKGEHAAAKENGRYQTMLSETTPTKSAAKSSAKSRKSGAPSKRALDFEAHFHRGSHKVPKEANEDVMDWQECIGNLLEEQPIDMMECELETATELPNLDLSGVSLNGVDFGSSEGSPEMDELLAGWEIVDDRVLA